MAKISTESISSKVSVIFSGIYSANAVLHLDLIDPDGFSESILGNGWSLKPQCTNPASAIRKSECGVCLVQNAPSLSRSRWSVKEAFLAGCRAWPLASESVHRMKAEVRNGNRAAKINCMKTFYVVVVASMLTTWQPGRKKVKRNS